MAYKKKIAIEIPKVEQAEEIEIKSDEVASVSYPESEYEVSEVGHYEKHPKFDKFKKHGEQ